MITLRGKTPVKFEFSDGISETFVVLQPDDDSDALRAKLYRVLELENSQVPQAQALPLRPPGAALAAAMTEPQFTPADRAAQEARLAGVQAMGWNEDAVDGAENLPEY